MEGIKRATLKDSIYTANVEISSTTWRELLGQTPNSQYRTVLNYFLSEPQHAATCKTIAEKHDLKQEFVSTTIIELGKLVQRELGQDKIYGTNNFPNYWLYPMYGRVSGREMKWVVRPELAEALAPADFKAFEEMSTKELKSFGSNPETELGTEISKDSPLREDSASVGENGIIDQPSVKEHLEEVNEKLRKELVARCSEIIAGEQGNLMAWKSDEGGRSGNEPKNQEKPKPNLPLKSESMGEDSLSLSIVVKDVPRIEPITGETQNIQNHSNQAKTTDPSTNFCSQNDSLADNYLFAFAHEEKEGTNSCPTEPNKLLSASGEQRDVPIVRRNKDSIPADRTSSSDFNSLQAIYERALENVDKIFYNWFPKYKISIKKYKALTSKIKSSFKRELFFQLMEDKGIPGIPSINPSLSLNFSTLKKSYYKISRLILDILKRGAPNIMDYNHLFQSFLVEGKSEAQAQDMVKKFLSVAFPGMFTTMLDYDMFRNVIKELSNRYSDYPEIQGNWFADNLAFISFCEKRVKFIESGHASLFIWYLRNYFEEGTRLRHDDSRRKLTRSTLQLLQTHKNLIIQGVSGIGKTQFAHHLGVELNAIMASPPTNSFGAFSTSQKLGKGFYSQINKYSDFKSFCKEAALNLCQRQSMKEEAAFTPLHLSRFFQYINQYIQNDLPFNLADAFNRKIGSIISVDSDGLILKESNGTRIKLPINRLLENFNETTWISMLGEEDSGREQRPLGAANLYYRSLLAEFNQFLKMESSKTSAKKQENKKDFIFVVDFKKAIKIEDIFQGGEFSLSPLERMTEKDIKQRVSSLKEGEDLFKDGSFVPENLYVIIIVDSSFNPLQTSDINFLKQFTWKTLDVEDGLPLLDGVMSNYRMEARKRLQALNNKICSMDLLGKEYQIGPAYFLKLDKYNGDFEMFWDCYLEWILYSHINDTPRRKQIMQELKLAYDLNAVPETTVNE